MCFMERVIEAPTTKHPQRYFTIIRSIGRGSEGNVYEARVQGWKSMPNVALKIHNPNPNQTMERMERYKNFIKNLIELPSSHQIIKVYDWLELGDESILVMELGKQNLQEYLIQNKNLSTMQKNVICLQVLQAIKFLHDQNIMHRDIKPDNFMIVGNKNDVKLIDFGIIRNDEDCLKTDWNGTQQYMAPEVLRGDQNYNKNCDIYSLGCVLYYIYTGEVLFTDRKQQQGEVNIQKINQIQITDDMKTIFRSMLNQDPNQRPEIQVIIDALIQNNCQYAFHFNIFISYMLNKNLSQWADDFQYFIQKLSADDKKQFEKKYIDFIESAKTVDNPQVPSPQPFNRQPNINQNNFKAPQNQFQPNQQTLQPSLSNQQQFGNNTWTNLNKSNEQF